MAGLSFAVLDGTWAVARLAPAEPVPGWATLPTAFSAVVRTRDELSIVCPESEVPPEVRAERGWATLQLVGPFAFTQVGVLAAVAQPLALAGIGIFAISTFDTDYVMVKHAHVPSACEALARAGHVRVPTA